ncbi:MAG: hypothetical protein AAGA68_24890 [Pseudomonadota bacterium]
MNTFTRSLSGLAVAALLVTGALAGAGQLSQHNGGSLTLENVYAPLDRMLAAVATRLDLTDTGTRPDLHERVVSRAKMGPRLAFLTAAGETRRLRVSVELDTGRDGTAGFVPAAALAALDARWVDGRSALIDLPGESLEAFARVRSVRHLRFVAVVATP